MSKSGEILVKDYKDIDGVWYCLLCDRTFATRQATTSHLSRTHYYPDKVCGHAKKGSVPWNIGLTKESDERVKKNSESLSQTINTKIEDGTFVPNRMGKAARKRLSERQSEHNTGGKCKWFVVSGQKLQGTWERNLAVKFNEMGIDWLKCKRNHSIKYVIENKHKTYTPDFYLPKHDLYLEIKGYWWGNDEEKMECVIEQTNKRIIVIKKDDYEKILGGELVW